MTTSTAPSDFYARLHMDVLDFARLSLREKADEIQCAVTIAETTGGSSDEITALKARVAQLRAAAASEDPMDAVNAYLSEKDPFN